MHLPVFAHALVWLENGNNQSRAENHHLGNVRHEREGQVQEEMKKLKIINRSGVEIQLAEIIAGMLVGNIITIAPDCEHNYSCDRYLDDKSIRLDLPPQHHVDRAPCIYLNGDFMDANKVAYVRKGFHGDWFVDPIHRGAKLVRKCVCNSTPLQIALVEIVLERKGVTKGVPGRDRPASRAHSEIEIPSRAKNLLIVDPEAVVKKHRLYVGRKRGPPVVGITGQTSFYNEDVIEVTEMSKGMASRIEHMEVTQESISGVLKLTYHRGLRFWL